MPARSALQWEVRRLETNIRGNVFVGEPRPELENAWHNLLQRMFLRALQSLFAKEYLDDNIRMPLDDFESDSSVVELADGSGAIAQLSVFHGLHCLVGLHYIPYFLYKC